MRFAMIPLLALALIAYVALRYTAPLGVSGPEPFLMGEWLGRTGFTVTMVSGDSWLVSLGDLFVTGSLILLFIEIVRSTRTHTASIVNHALSMGVVIICLILIIVVPGFATGPFFLLTIMTVLDVIAGFTISIVTAKRDLDVAPVGSQSIG